MPDILGSDYDGRIAGEIRTRTENKTLRGLRYYGRNTLIKLCSGDISYLIDMLGQMLRNSEELPISIETQHKVIKQYAWRVLYRLNDHPAKTCNLYQVALNFGRLSLFKLRGKMVATGQSSQRPAEYLRIEVSLGRDTDVEIAQPIIAELLQSGIFIDGGFSNSSQQNPARRLLFRKIFTPAFPTTYNSRDTFSMTAKNFADFAKAPERFLRAQMGEDGVRPEDQQSMMDALIDRAV